MAFCGMCMASSMAQVTLNIDAGQRGASIGGRHYGIFFEEINHAGDGGLYAELIHNRSFEDNASNPDKWWAVGNARMAVVTDGMLNEAQEHALELEFKGAGDGVRNEGFWGIHVVNGQTYKLSFWIKGSPAYKGVLTAELQTEGGQSLGSRELTVDVGSEWTKLTAEIQKCNAAMQKAQEQQQALGDATEETGQAADDAASAQANLAESTSEAGNQQRSAAENAKHYGEALDKLAKGATQAGKALTKVLTLPIVGMGTASVKYGMELEDAVYEVATLPGVLSGTQEQRQQQIRDLTDELINASNDAHTAATELASATYDAISAGVAPEDAAYWAERAAMAGKAGRSDASTVINGASSIYNAWGAKASGGLDHILDSMITAQNLGKTTVGELSSQIGQVSGLAPQLSLSMEEVLSSVAALTAGGLSTSSAITGLRGVLSAVIKPTSEAAEMAKELGIDFSAAGLKA